jgi:hypothetical protein
MSDEATRSEPPAAISEFHDQDWLIVVEALAPWLAIRLQSPSTTHGRVARGTS